MGYSEKNGYNASNISVNGQDEDTIILSLKEDGDKDDKEEDEDLSHLCNKSINTLDEDVQLTEDFFGYSDPSLVANIVPTKRFTWTTKNKLVVQLITYGATIISIEAPDRLGQTVDIVLGFNEIEGYTKNHQYSFGSTIGRVVNIIEDSSFAIRSKIYVLSSNLKDHHYNGGKHGFDKVNWDWHIEDKKVTLSYLSPEGEAGYPGSLLTQITYTVTVDNTIIIQMKSTATEPTPVNISNNIYFNLAGHNAGASELYNHFATINADKYTPVTDDQIPTGEKLPVGGTLFNFRIPKLLSDVIPSMSTNGYNSNFCLTKGVEQELSFAARFLHSKSGRVLEVYSDQPGLQFDTANHLPDPDAICEGSQIKITPPIIGKSGASYTRHGGFCLKSQGFPNAMNQKRFPKVILRPGNEYTHKIVMKFGLQLGKYL